MRTDPDESPNLLYDAEFKAIGEQMETKLYAMMEELGGMEIPLNAPVGGRRNQRLKSRGGERAADFASPFVVDQPLKTNAH